MSDGFFMEKGIKYPLYDWQQKAHNLWRENGYSGIVSAVTGSGKTRLAAAIISTWLKNNPKGSVSIIVSKISLLGQWKSDIGPIFYDRNIGQMGGGSREWYGSINILVIDTAVKVLGGRQGGLSEAHLVIVDECHSLGAETYRQALTCNHHATLGLSATPERDDTGLEVIAPLLGDVIIKYDFAQAIKDGVIPPFTVKAVKIDLQHRERLNYDRLQMSIRNYTKKLTQKYGGHGNLVSRCQYLLKTGTQDSDIGGYLTAIREQKELVNSAKNRFAVLDIMLHNHITKNEQSTMLFHESVSEIQEIARKYAHMNPLEYHYKATTTKKKKEQTLQDFKDGKSKLLLSCRALSEGVNLPQVEVGIMLSGTRSVRSRIQTLGRLLRGEEATIYFVYVGDTKDTRSLSNLVNKGGIPEANIEYWEYSKAKGKLELTTNAESIKTELKSIYSKEKKWNNQNNEVLTCEHCCRGMKGSKTRPFKTLNGQATHKIGCKDARSNVYRCFECNKVYASKEKRDEHMASGKCEGIENMTWDDFMAGFSHNPIE